MPCDWLAMAAAAAATPFPSRPGPARPVPSLPPRRRRQRHCVRPGPASTATVPPPTLRPRPNPASAAPATPPGRGGARAGAGGPRPVAGRRGRAEAVPPALTEVSEGLLRPLPENKLKMRREPPLAAFRKAREGVWFYLFPVPCSLASQQTPSARCR